MKDRVFSVRTDKASEELIEHIFLQLSNEQGHLLKRSAAFAQMLKIVAAQKGIAVAA